MNTVMDVCTAIYDSFTNSECIVRQGHEQTQTKNEGNQEVVDKRHARRTRREIEDQLEDATATMSPCISVQQEIQYKSRLEGAKRKFQEIAGAGSKVQNEMMKSPPDAKEVGGSNDAQFKVAQSRMHLQNLLQIQQMAQQRVTKSMENLGNLNARLKTIDLQSVSLQEVIELLNEMARALTEMIKLWRNLQHFFYNVQKHARILKDSSRKFADLGRKHTEIVSDGLVDESDKTYRREMVYQMVVDAQQVKENLN